MLRCGSIRPRPKKANPFVAIPSASFDIQGDGTVGELITRPRRAEGGRRVPAVLQIVPALEAGGVERGAVEVAAALTAAGWRAVVASAGGRLVAELDRVGAHHVHLPLATKNPARMAANAGRLARLIEEENIDLVHARSRAPAWSALIAARRTGRPFVTTFHAVYGGRSWPKRHYNSVMARGDRVIAISRFVAEHAVTTYGLPADRVRIIERGIDLAEFDPDRVGASRVAALIAAWNLDRSRPVLMLPARLARGKGHGMLIEALGRLGRRDIVCLLVGGGADRHRQDFEREVAARGLEETCRFVDHCDDMPAAYSLADIVVSPATRPEGFGRTIIEGLAMGRPVIAADHGGAREILAGRDIGWLVPPGDPTALARALEDVLGLDRAQLAERAARARAFMRERYTRARMTDLTLGVYGELLGADAASHEAWS
jgi:glycosyltransferase involved in cell wall biosynthesis